MSALFMAFGVACVAGLTVAGALLDRFPRAVLNGAVATGAASLLGLYAAGTVQAAAVVCLMLLGGATASVFTATQNEMLRWAPARTDLALAANSGAYNAGIAGGAALGGLVLRYGDVRAPFLAGGLVAGAWAVLCGGRVLERRGLGPQPSDLLST